MAVKILGPTGSKRRKRFLLVPMLLVACTALFLVASAQAVHDLAFQLDGETTNVAYSPPAGSSPTKDWNDLFNADGTTTNLVDKTASSGFVAADFTRDFSSKSGRNGTCSTTSSGTTFCTSDDTTFATGSKDTLDITPGWQCNIDNNVNSKIDIMNAYAASYIDPNVDPDTGKHDHIIYFGMEKNKDNGTNDVGFWFLQGNANCESPGGNTAWTGHHVNGDVLVVSEFSNGGGVSNVTAYKWQNGALISFGQGGDCKTAPTGQTDSLCATTNATGLSAWNQNVTTKWLTSDATLGVGHTAVPPDFFEGGINITKVFQAANSTAPSCFNTFVGDTRSSKETTATLFDYARGQLGECSVSMTTSPSSTANRDLGSTTSITDTATVVGTAAGGGSAPTPTGTVTFYLCGPSDLTSPDPNNPGQFVSDPNGTCNDSDGSQVGSAVTLVQKLDANNNPIVGTAVATSADVHTSLTSVGKYCFRAHYVAAANDLNYPGATAETGNPAQECFNVVATASTSTTQKWLPQDSAHVTATGGATVAGYVVFQLYESTDCTGSPVQTFGNDPSARITVDSSGNATTNNTTYYVNQNVQISWKATFTSTNSVGSGSAAPCERSDIANLDDDITTP
jgi:hypothetical protein